MRSTTLLLQVVGVALVAPSWALTQFGPSGAYRFQESSSDSGFGGDYSQPPIPVTTKRPKPAFQILANEEVPQPIPSSVRNRQKYEDPELFRQQAESAKYTFASALSDRIMDGEHIRQETRDGLKTSGMYSYSDGFYRRTVEYVADENGYRVVKQTVEPIGDGPQPDPSGSADISSFYDRSKLQYSITRDDIRGYPTPEDYEFPPTRPVFNAPQQRPAIFSRVPVQQNEPTDDEDYTTTTENVLRSVERHDSQVPARPSPLLRNQHFLRPFSH